MESFRDFDVISIEDDIKSTRLLVEVSEFRIAGTLLEVVIAGRRYTLKAATVNDLSQLPGSPIKNKITGDYQIFTIIQESFYNNRRKPTKFLRILYENEIKELYNTYFYRKLDGSIPIDCFPDSGKTDFKYRYIVIKDSVILNSGTFSKHWLVQMKLNESKKNFLESSVNKMCKWEGCMSSLVHENHLAKMISEFNLLTNKAKSLQKKGLNPLKRSRTASEAIMVTDLCIFHNNLRSILRNEGVLIKDYVSDNSTELWKASQSGVSWQEHLSDNNKLSQLSSGFTKSSLCTYFEDYSRLNHFNPYKENTTESNFQSQKEDLLKEIETLKVSVR